MPDKDEFALKAHKNVTRARTSLILQLSRNGMKKDEINGVISLIDWKEETEWQAEELREAAKLSKPGPVPVPIPPPNSVEQNVAALPPGD
jgi:hypothetical protein